MRSIPLWVQLLLVIGLLAGTAVGLAFVPTGQLAYAPHEPIDLEGRVLIDGEVVEPLQGHLYLVGVTERPVNMLQRLLLDLGDPQVDFAPEPRKFSEGPTAEDVEAMQEAKINAAAVSFNLLNRPVEYRGNGAVVSGIEPGTPAAKKLQIGDILSGVDGRELDTSVEIIDAIGSKPPGTTVRLTVRRDARVSAFNIKTVRPERDDGVNLSRIGAKLSTINARTILPSKIAIDADEVVGPSAGLAFSVYVYDASSRIDLMRGRYIVATGALSADGQVVEVGRVKQKAYAAQEAGRDILVVPVENGPVAKAAVDESCTGDQSCIRVLPVASVKQTIDYLRMSDVELEPHLL